MSSLVLVLSAFVPLMGSSLISLSSGISQEVLSSICFHTENQETCESILESDPRTASADLPQLSLISIELAQKQAEQNHATFSKLRDTATNSSVKDSLRSCVGTYEVMLDKIKQAHKLSEAKQYDDIGRLTEANSMAIQCENGVPSGFSETEESSQKMILTCQSAIYVNAYIMKSM